MTVTAPLISYFGSKFRVAPWVLSHLPPHEIYVEPFGGSAAVLMQKARSRIEIYNDLDGEIVNLFRVVRDDAMRALLIDALNATPYARAEFEAAWHVADEPVERARRLCIRAQMGFGATGSTRPLHSPIGFAADVWSDGPGQWLRYPARLAAVGSRLRGTMIEHMPAVELIAKYDAPGVLFYVDPPYLPEVRNSVSRGLGRDYRCEMSAFEHADLLAMLANLRGMAVVSGYASGMYDRALAGWARFTRKTRANGQAGTVPREEVIWVSPSACAAAGIEPRASACVDPDADEMPLFAATAARA
ncbi:DNA adenine methylase [Burkholderia cenocepacia]|uniref:DNA adenine methylase n=2 Tax=Burkholderia cenocepacia TaxID=95486 RepID=UPI00078B3251|nr:DNA adenine methylase [Burkholderia cenocepacia]DAF76987.1 MAG TPA: DNA adenine methylase [Caudoviricetes sp.]AMU18857.1 DNA methyltransferase [Burkholderia cenocepacia]MCW3585312.1 DNA adenine methylase [Burkholderia cenocepacia]MCW3627295.1 DNA adenine methylase [Burkholderia cenocepacia]MCW5184901.1 DNA adenine methylase [Burkholderia cenocepacia]